MRLPSDDRPAEPLTLPPPRRAGLCAGLLLLSLAPAGAQAGGRFAVTVEVGYSTVDVSVQESGKGTATQVELGPSPLLSAGLRLAPLPPLAFALTLSAAPWHRYGQTDCLLDPLLSCVFPKQIAGERAATLGADLTLLARLPSGPVRPFAGVGIGLSQLSTPEGHASERSGARRAWILRGGLEFPVRGRALVLEVRQERVSNPSFGLDPLDDTQIRVGLVFPLGAP